MLRPLGPEHTDAAWKVLKAKIDGPYQACETPIEKLLVSLLQLAITTAAS